MLIMTDESVLFVRRHDGAVSEDVWDDSALIKAYDKAIGHAKKEVSKRLGVNAEHHSEKQKKSERYKEKPNLNKKWQIGSPCQAVYSDDGELYEATIVKIHENLGTCTVQFVGYNNIETVELTSLLESEGLERRIAQQKEALESLEDGENTTNNKWQEDNSNVCNKTLDETMDCEINEAKTFSNVYGSTSSFNPTFSIMPPAPPLPPQLMSRLPGSDADALSSMLMSWYISGFHTGYYHGLKESKKRKI